MPARLSRLVRVLLAVPVLLVGLAAAPPVRTPFAGSWKVTFTEKANDLSLWVVQIDKPAATVKLVAGVRDFANSKITDVRRQGEALAFTIAAGTMRYQISVQPGFFKDTDTLRGCMQVGGNLTPIWLQRTTVTELTEANALRKSPGFDDLLEAIKLPQAEDRMRELRAITRNHAGKPVQILALQAVLSELVRGSADTKPFQEVAESYRRVAKAHGPEFLAGANLELARNLLAYPKALPVVIDSARETLRLAGPDTDPGIRLNAYKTLAAALLQQGGKADEVKAISQAVGNLSDEILARAVTPQAKFNATVRLGMMLIESPAAGIADRGLECFRLAVKELPDGMSVAERAQVYRLYQQALGARGKLDEANELAPTLEKLDAEVDEAYRKELIPFDVEKVPARKGTGKRVALVELFTGSQYRSAIAGVIAYDAALQAFSPKDVVFLQYHIPSPEPDVMMNADSETRAAFYKSDLEGVPAMFVDGKLTPALGGFRQRGKESYDLAKDAIVKGLESAPTAAIKLTVTRNGDMVTAKADISDVKELNAGVRVRFALVEELVRYPGSSGVRLHHHVVRGFFGGASGLRVDKKETTQTASLNLGQVRKSLEDYLAGVSKKTGVAWPVKPLALTKLKVICFVQDEESKQVFQAAQADVPAK